MQGMIDSFAVPDEKALNPAAGIQMPLDDRGEAGALSAADMLDESSPTGMKPLALFNRFDLAPDNWSHCGEHRIVYGRERPNPNNPFDRFLLIFEAMVPNPDPGAGAAGCRRVAEFWAGLTGLDAAEQASRLSGFYYDGVTGHPDGDLVDADGNPAPVVSFRNYGGDGGRGQVRANAFMVQPWQLREWLTQLTFAEAGPALAFVPVTVKDNPLAELYHDTLASDTDVLAGNVPDAVANLHGQFVQALTASIGPRLLSETSAKHQELAEGLQDYDLGSAPAVGEATILLSTIALGNADMFNEHQSVSQGDEDVPGAPLGSSVAVTQLLDQVGAAPTPSVTAQTGQTLLNRARAGSCGGCHMTAAGEIVRENPNSTVVRWPDVAAGGFVHVLEPTRALSPALEDAFLPVRRYVLGRYLCETLAAEPAPAPEPVPVPEPLALALAQEDLPVEAVTGGARYLDAIVGAYAQEVRGGAEAAAVAPDASLAAVVSDMSPAARDALRARVAGAIAVAREVELQRPGAFVATRRPH